MIRQDVIVAQATSTGIAGVSIVRLSGPDQSIIKLIDVLSLVKADEIKPRYAYFTTFLDSNKDHLDEGILLYFKAPHSFTGESVLELQCHGGLVVSKLLIKACLCLGARMADPGEFSMRAVLNQKMTTLKAEAILGVVHAQDEAQARAAIRSMQGDFADRVHVIAQKLKHVRVMIESIIDFDDESDVEAIVSVADLMDVFHLVQQLRQQATMSVQLSQDQQICLIGPPNAGKSSWMNRLMEQEAAIVSPQAGTTRDLVEKRVMIADRWVLVTDTAGLRQSSDDIEQQGVQKAKEKTKSVDVSIWVVDVESLDELSALSEDLPDSPIKQADRYLILWNKRDLKGRKVEKLFWHDVPVYTVTAHEEKDVDFVRTLIADKLDQPEPDLFYARDRHLRALTMIEEKLSGVINYAKVDFDVVWVAECMREIQDELDKLVGLFSTEDLLGEIFGSFCIGK